ncbi:MAG TPA: DUF4276 family protein [Thermoanaerobaculia bacterium]|nr:DUF4276 family protein [Thermoanaerobaculia bacterium]
MTIEHLEILVEEPSAEAALRALLPRFLADVTFAVYSHGGKADLMAKLTERLRGYAAWLPHTWRIVVVVDRDDEDCMTLKKRMDGIAAAAGLVTPSASRRRALVNRIAIEELEAWYFGDWTAVRTAFPKVRATIPSQSRYRNPDAIAGGTWEAFERILQTGGYMKGGLRKIEAARAVAERMQPDRNTSRSFQAFWRAIVDHG